jgi:hypothetical protein
MRVITRERLMAKLEKAYPNMFLSTTEEFNGRKGGIWTSGEDSPLDKKGLPLFDYWAMGTSYSLGVRPHFANFLERNGWFAEWNDAGTIMLWKIPN